MFIDSYIPKRLIGVTNSFLIDYKKENNITTKSQNKKLLEGMSCLVYNLSHCVSLGHKTLVVTLNKNLYSDPIIYNGVVMKRKVSYYWFKICLDWMVSKGLITLQKGSVGGWEVVGGRYVPGNTSPSIVELSSGIFDMLLPVSSFNSIEVSKNVIELRDSEGVSVPFKLTSEHHRLIELIDTYNQYLLEASLTINGIRYCVQGRKVYNEDFYRGGRTYLTGYKVMSEFLRKDFRAGLLINDEPTLELDFSAMHPSIIAEMEGFTMPSCFDPYGLTLDGYDPDCLRRIAKVALLVGINSGSDRQAAMALSLEAFNNLPIKDWKETGKIPNILEASKIIQEVKKHNQYCLPWFGESKGLLLQNIDSKIMDRVIEMCLQEGIVCIVIHDSIIVQRRYEQIARTFMENAYKGVLGSSNNCRISVKNNF